MTEGEVGIALVAAPSDSAEVIAKTIVEQRLAACAQVTSPVTSVYWWKEKLEKAPERLIFLKTERSCVPRIGELLGRIHPYEVPELIFLPVTAGSDAYLAWLSATIAV